MPLPKSYGIALGWPMAGGQVNVSTPTRFNLRTVPGTDQFHIVVRNPDGSGDVIRMERNIGGQASSSNVGEKWPEWRYTGRWRVPTFTSPVGAQSVVFFEDRGAQDIVASNASGKFFGSFHGLGAAGALNSETLTMDGVAFDPTVATNGNTFSLRNTTTATDGTTTFTRDLTTTIDASGAVAYTLNSVSGTAVSYYYAGMLTGSGSFSEFDVQMAVDGSWFTAPPMGLSPNNSYTLPTVAAKGFRSRNTTTGAAVTITSPNISGAANYVRSETERTNVNDRQKVYFGRFTDAAAMAGLTWVESASVGAAGTQFAKTNQLTNGDFATGDLTGWTRQNGTTDPTVVGGAMRMVREAGALRMRQTNPVNLTAGQLIAFQMDLLALSGGGSPIARVGNSTALSSAGALVSQQMSGIARNTFLTVASGVTTAYAGTELAAGTLGQTADVDNFGLWVLS
jgi:hypothetical protein